MTQRHDKFRIKQADELRARAKRVRKHARQLCDDPAGQRLEIFADELEASAQAIEQSPQRTRHSTDSEGTG